MLPDSLEKIVCYSDIEYALGFIGYNIHIIESWHIFIIAHRLCVVLDNLPADGENLAVMRD
jgi:hypothetical protein